MSLSNPSATVETTEVAVAQTNAVATQVSGTPSTSLTALNGAFKAQGFEMEPGLAKPCTIHSGKIKANEDLKEDMGDHIDIQALDCTVYQKINLGVAGSPNEAEKALALSCKDGETVTDKEGNTHNVHAYMDSLRAKYPKVKLEDRAALTGFFLGCDKQDKTTLKAVGEHDEPDLITVYMSPSSLKAYKQFLMKTSMFAYKGGTKMRLTSKEASWNGNTWTLFQFATLQD